jgi:hypothetical protein
METHPPLLLSNLVIDLENDSTPADPKLHFGTLERPILGQTSNLSTGTLGLTGAGQTIP